ncbi:MULTISPECIES: hypothetical protein [unclassified Pseudomonas]|uniref:DUF6957 family protein n=1 Tax=unclassified Pseudomonas TaxID=196821 RepID=UPI002AB4FACE|nr:MULTISPECIES: hypothetical protein [unclassified Pseudomonas]MDY7560426.1 hypothetical protein [Pseudomonas sp. AB6]MEA9977342.1 hypothetical protein [Pseudomonas sp. RTS4]MEA9993184.1 hypothetical protein [Pseudomonas sp. AA4]MEB0039357.1 hypothetical protein [Pseudomonas sp. MH10]MEB0076006.1 hypothetical protein [Pseudomonas sp. MH10out]
MNPAADDKKQLQSKMPVSDDELLGELLFGPALMRHGSELNDAELARITSETFPARSFCIVRIWMLIDVEFTPRLVRLLEKDDLSPTVLYANSTTYAADAQSDTSHGVLSGFQRKYQDCFFETEDMIYVLAGRGARKSAGVPTVFALAEKCGRDFRRNHD